MRRRLPLLLVIVLLVAAMPVQAQGGNTLTVLCSAQEEWCGAMAQAFQEQTGIATTYVWLSSEDGLARLRASAGSPEASVWWGAAAESLVAAADDGLLAPYQSPNAALIDQRYMDAENHTWTGVFVGILGFCSNAEILYDLGLEPPASWEDLLNPALQGNITLGHPAATDAAFTMVWTQVTLAADALERAAMQGQGMSAGDITAALAAGEYVGAGYDSRGYPNGEAIDNAFAYFDALNPNVRRYVGANSAPGRMAGTGEVAVAIVFDHDCALFQQEGFDNVLADTFPTEGTGYGIGGVALIADAPAPDAARMWYDWALTADAQAIGQTVDAFQLPTNPDTPVSDLVVNPSDVNLLNYNFEAAGLSRADIVDRFDGDIAPQPAD
jgi:iron(III) transport system substrate-binding protein